MKWPLSPRESGRSWTSIFASVPHSPVLGREISKQKCGSGHGFLKGACWPQGSKGGKGGRAVANGLICKALLPGVLLLLGGHVEVEVKLPAPLGITGQGRHHPFAGGARRLEQPYCRHTSGQLLGEVTKRRSIYLSSGSTETRHVTLGGCFGLGPASGSIPSLLSVSHPVIAPRLRDRALGRGSGGLGLSWKVRQILPSLSEPQSFLQLNISSMPGPKLGNEDIAVSKPGCQLQGLQIPLRAMNETIRMIRHRINGQGKRRAN